MVKAYFNNSPMKKTPFIGKSYYHIHHDILLDPATKPIKNKIKYIKKKKLKEEQALRLKLIKPITKK
jgi:hypothetical protein